MEPTMRVYILSSRDTDPNVMIALSFNVTFGPPSRALCYYNDQENAFFNSRDDLSREVIRSQYSNSKPDMTRVRVKVTVDQQMRGGGLYRCEVVVEGRAGIASGTYAHLNMGQIRSTTVTITGEWLTRLLNQCYMFLLLLLLLDPLLMQLQAPPLVSLPTGLATPLSWSPGLPHHHHQLAMRCSIRHQMIQDSVEGTLATLHMSWHWLDWHQERHILSSWWLLEKRELLCYQVVTVTQP